MAATLELTRTQILAFRRRAGALEERLPPGPRSLRTAAWAGLQDSMPRAALLSIHARVEGAHPEIWDDDAFVQVWGPRWATYVVPAEDHAIFTVGRHPDSARGRERAESWAARIAAREPNRSNGERYATTTGTVLIRWDGARAPDVWTVPRPAIEPLDARRELARRYLHVFGPGTSASFATWAGVTREGGRAPRSTDSSSCRSRRRSATRRSSRRTRRSCGSRPSARPRCGSCRAATRTGCLHDAAHRALLVPDAKERAALWTPRVWPGALLVAGELAGTWRRAQGDLSLEPWRQLTKAERAAVEAEAASLPLPGPRRRRSRCAGSGRVAAWAYVLYWRPGTASMAPHAALAEIGTDYRLVEIGREEAQGDASYRALNPLGVVPTLVDSEQDLVLTESAAILLYLGDRFPESQLAPDASRARLLPLARLPHEHRPDRDAALLLPRALRRRRHG